MTAGQPVLVLHGPGDKGAGGPWAVALRTAGWPGPVLAPDLPGHGTAPAPEGGAYELVDAALHVLPAPIGRDRERPVVVGVGANGWAAQLLALGGRAAALVLVDGLGGPWRSPAHFVADERAWLRSVAEDPAATGPPPAVGLDPRLRHAVPRQTSIELARRGAGALAVPVLVLESPGSSAGVELDDLVRRIADVNMRTVPAPDAATVARTIVTWDRASTAPT